MATNVLSPQQPIQPQQPVVPAMTPKTLPAGIIGQRNLRAGYTMVKFGLAADRPTTTNEIVLYFATDTFVMSFWTGTEWKDSAAFT